MKNSFHQLSKVILRITFLSMGLFFAHSGLYAQTSKEYTEAETATLLADIEAHSYDEFILSSDGGVYTMSDIDLSADVVIKAKESYNFV